MPEAERTQIITILNEHSTTLGKIQASADAAKIATQKTNGHVAKLFELQAKDRTDLDKVIEVIAPFTSFRNNMWNYLVWFAFFVGIGIIVVIIIIKGGKFL